MTLDETLLRVLRTRDGMDRFGGGIPDEGIDPKTRALVKDFKAYFKDSPDVQRIELAPFWTYFKLRHPRLRDDQLVAYHAVVSHLAADPETGAEAGLRLRLAEARTAAALQTALERWSEGDCDLTAALREISELHDRVIHVDAKLPEVKDRIEDILSDDENDVGFHWGLECLDEAMRPMRSGDFGVVAARIDTGKTSAIASILANFAPQVDPLFPGQDRTIVVLNNEGPGRRMKHRLYNALLRATTPELIQYSHDGSIYERYVKAQGGRDLLHVLDVHDYGMSDLEGIVQELRPAVLVIDMLDNVRMDATVNNGGQRTDQILEALYQRARLWAVKYDCAVLATSQLSGEAEGLRWPTKAMLANSRTGKGGAADFILLLGCDPSEGFEHSRFISLVKNKNGRTGKKRDPHAEVVFDPDRALLLDPVRVTEE